MPHFVLDARSDDGILSSLPHQPRRHQRLSLEGDFDTHFHLFAPKGYERDGLYVFTPDLTALPGRRLTRSLPRWARLGIGIAAAAVLVPVGILITVFSVVNAL